MIRDKRNVSCKIKKDGITMKCGGCSQIAERDIQMLDVTNNTNVMCQVQGPHREAWKEMNKVNGWQ